MRALLASPLGFLIGLSLGALGGGGSILAVPALVYGAGQGAKAATSTSLLIVGISSVFGMVGFPEGPGYAASKAGVAQLTRQMTADFGHEGININAIAPGVIDTPMTHRAINEDAWYQEAMIKNTPMGIGQPDDIAAVAAFLCSDDARYVAGQVIPVDGGWLGTRYWPRD